MGRGDLKIINDYSEYKEPDVVLKTGKSHSQKLSSVVSIELFEHEACAIDKKNKLYCWGGDEYGLVGNPLNWIDTGGIPTAVEVPEVSNVAQVDLGLDRICIVDLSKRVYCWKWIYDASLITHRSTVVECEREGGCTYLPVRMNLPSVESVEVGDEWTCVTRKKGRPLCWASKGAPINKLLHMPMHAEDAIPLWEDDVVQVEGTTGQICLRKRDGRISCFGQNYYYVSEDHSDCGFITPTYLRIKE